MAPAARTEVRFGRTLLVPRVGDIFDQPVNAVICAANARGLMGAGVAGAIRLAGGAEIEREAMAHAPLALGSALATGAGRLRERGIQTVIHAVVNHTLGAPPRLDVVRRATGAALAVADQCRVRSLAMPPLGAGTNPGGLSADDVAMVMVDETVAFLRRFPGRIERIVLVARFEQEAVSLQDAVDDAQERWWRMRP